uniref:Occlusion derived envelope/capsid protein n=1 Tax=Spilarctia obliqua nucleopolyhedrovirus TaxID=1638618 RepID=A0A7G9U8B1_9ABAC|nr:occlusion derived envelope/capsid protein [Spilarctia obliqua nucleopolyhedrovirus]
MSSKSVLLKVVMGAKSGMLTGTQPLVVIATLSFCKNAHSFNVCNSTVGIERIKFNNNNGHYLIWKN